MKTKKKKKNAKQTLKVYAKHSDVSRDLVISTYAVYLMCISYSKLEKYKHR